jgi:hypothetical protein
VTEEGKSEERLANPLRLQIYLNDHLAGATAGLELARRLVKENRGTPYERRLVAVAGEIQEDRATLQTLMGRVGAPVRTWKVGASWLAEKLSRLKLNGSLVGYSPLSRLVELEALATGIQGKVALWRTLLQCGGQVPHHDAMELERLIGRARRQLRRVEGLHAEAAEAAFV